MGAHASLELRSASIDEVVADVRAVRSLGLGRTTRFVGELDGRTGNVGFAGAAVARDALDRMAVGVAGGEVHPRIHIGGIVAQRVFDRRQGLDELTPVGRSEQAQASDAVAHRDLLRGLVLRFELYAVLDGLVVLGQPLLHPGQWQCERSTAAMQPARELGHEGRGHRRIGARHFGDD